MRAKVAGAASRPGPTELRRVVERLARGDRHAWGALRPPGGVTAIELWAAVEEVFGATASDPSIDPVRTLDGAARAAARVRAVAEYGGRIAFATATPGSFLPLHLAIARLARAAGAEVPDPADAGPIRADGRSGRCLRWFDGVAAVSDGAGLCATRDAEPAREWLFVLARPALVVADGSFADVAWEAGLEVVGLAGLDHAGLAVPAARGDRCVVVPLRNGMPPRAYAAVTARFAEILGAPAGSQV